MPVSFSVALAACNGALYLPEFLDSLTSQTLPPQELVAADDASNDGTAILLEAFAARAPFQVRILRNPRRLGVVENFSRAMAACNGNAIALADQDDVWRAEKLEKLALALEQPDTMAAFSDAEVVDEGLEGLGYTMWQQIGFNARRQRLLNGDQPWEALFKDPVVTGATLMFKRELLPYILPIPDSWLHDAWIAQIAVSQGQLAAINETLVLYRQHGSNAIGGKRKKLSEQIRSAYSLGRLGLVERELRRFGALHDRLSSFPASPRRDCMLALSKSKIAHLERRRSLPSNRLRRLPTVWQEWRHGNYRRFAKDWRNVAADLLMP